MHKEHRSVVCFLHFMHYVYNTLQIVYVKQETVFWEFCLLSVAEWCVHWKVYLQGNSLTRPNITKMANVDQFYPHPHIFGFSFLRHNR
jgi:hypothetical protein